MSFGLGSTESAEPLVRPAANERLKPEANRVGVRSGAGRGARLAQQALVDVQRLLHTDKYAIRVWQSHLQSGENRGSLNPRPLGYEANCS